MSSVEIADVDAALGKVRAFIVLLDMNHTEWQRTSAMDASTTPLLKTTTTQINAQLPLIVRIATRADADIASKMAVHHASYGWSYYSIKEASEQLVGLLSSVDEIERILGPRGPKLAAANLHPWVWNAAVNLWDDGHRREAVQAAATALFDQHLPAKLGVPGPTSARDRVSQAFASAAPTPGKPRLRLDDYPNPSANWTSQHEGAQYFGMGCAALIRNLATHTGTQPDEQDALEQLAALSALARLIDRAKVVH
jgi:hypothetical protein